MLGVNLTSPAFVYLPFHDLEIFLVILSISASLKTLNQVCTYLCRSFFHLDHKTGQKKMYNSKGLYLAFYEFANLSPPKGDIREPGQDVDGLAINFVGRCRVCYRGIGPS